MGQYGNQPDFGVIVEGVSAGIPFPPSAIFVGELNEGLTTCSIRILPAGQTNSVWFTGIGAGTFLPIVITEVVDLTGVVSDNILVYR